jgi:cytochrome c oxidase subunit I
VLGAGFTGEDELAVARPNERCRVAAVGRLRSERPAFELHYPHMVERMRAESHYSVLKRDQRDVGVDQTTEKVLAPTDRETEHD